VKNRFKQFAALLLAVTLCLSLAACSGKEDAPASDTPQESGALTIGILQFGSHPSLDNCYQGIIEGLEASELTYTVDRQDGNFDSATCDTIAKNMVAKEYDIIFAIATPAAVSSYAAAANSEVPVIFCAVSDPMAAGLIEDSETPGGNCTGTSDLLDLSAQVEMISTFQPGIQKIGVLYTTSEANSISQLQQLREVVAPYGIEIVEQGVQSAADIPQAAAALAAQVDCINNFTDNNVVSNLTQVLDKATEAGIPVYGSEVEQVKNGCLAAASIDYVALGRETANMGVQVLQGTAAGTIPVRYIADSTPVINPAVAQALGIEIPAGYQNAEMVEAGAE
jgi:ABC-type uncharacterized transport system, periplasmic component